MKKLLPIAFCVSIILPPLVQAAVVSIVDTRYCASYGETQHASNKNPSLPETTPSEPKDVCEGYTYTAENCGGEFVLRTPCPKNGSLYKECACPGGLANIQEFADLLGVDPFYLGFTGNEKCARISDCPTLGYEKTASQCNGDALLCPFDNRYAYCL